MGLDTKSCIAYIEIGQIGHRYPRLTIQHQLYHKLKIPTNTHHLISHTKKNKK